MTSISIQRIMQYLAFFFAFLHLASALVVDVDATLSKVSVFNDPITVSPGVTLLITGAASYTFNADIVNYGTIDIQGKTLHGVDDIKFASTVTIKNEGVIEFEDLRPSGDAADFVIAPAAVYNEVDINNPYYILCCLSLCIPTSSIRLGC